MADVTDLLNRWSAGDQQAFEELVPVVYGEMRRIARRLLNHERPDHTLQSTELVHEAYLRLVDQDKVSWNGRAHFFAAAANSMRRILVDHARRRLAGKRGSGSRTETLDAALGVALQPDFDLLELDRALEEFSAIDLARAKIVELRYFGGLSLEETARTVGRSPSAVARDWNIARAWLFQRLRCLKSGEPAA